MTQNERIGLPIWKKTILIIITLIVFIIQMALIIATFQLEFNIESQTLYYIVEILAFCFVLRILNIIVIAVLILDLIQTANIKLVKVQK